MSSSELPWTYDATAVEKLISNQHFYDLFLGPILIGLAGQMFMMGCLCIQMWKYFEDFSSDSVSLKTFVTVLFLASALQCATDFHIMYDTFVSHFGNIIAWDHYGWTFSYECAWTAVIAALAQGFLLHRCWTVTHSYTVVVLGGLGLLVSLSAGVATSVGTMARPYYTQTSNVVVQVTTWLIASALTDLGISIVLIAHLRKMRTGFKRTEKTLSKIVRLTFETAGLTSAIALVDLLLYLTMSKVNSIHLALQLIVGKTYNHSVMVTLLARSNIRKDFDSNSVGRIGNSDGSKSNTGAGPTGITVTRTQIRVTDNNGMLEYPMKSLERDEYESEGDRSSTKMPAV